MALEYEAAKPPAKTSDLGKRTVTGSLWTVGTYFSLNVIRLGSNLILTRLLVPEMFGTMVIVNTVMVGIRLFSDVGIGPSLISNPRGSEERFLRTAYTIQVVRGFIIWMIACALSIPISRIYGSSDPQLHDLLMKLLPVAGISAVIEGLRSTAIFRVQRDLRFGPLSIIELIEMSTTAVGMVIFAMIDPSVWALLIAPLVGNVVGAVLSHVMLYHDRRDRFGFDREIAAEMTRFGRWIFVSTLITFFASQFDKLIFGKLVDAHTLGIYGIAVGLAVMPINAILKVGATVLFPTFARVAGEPDRFRDVFARARTMLLAAGAMIVCGMIGAGPFVIHALYKDVYADAGWMLQLLAIGCWFQIVDASNSAALLSHQKPVWIAAANLGKVIFMFGLVPITYHLAPFGDSTTQKLAAAFVALSVADAARAVVSTSGMRRVLKADLRVVLPDVIFPFVIAGVAILSYEIAHHFLGDASKAFSGMTDKWHRVFSNGVIAALAAVIVLVVWAPICVWQWRRSKRGNAATPSADHPHGRPAVA